MLENKIKIHLKNVEIVEQTLGKQEESVGEEETRQDPAFRQIHCQQ